MNRRPEFTIVAGPNGAGKSRLCPFYIHAVCFDGDKLALELKKQHPDWPERWISGTVVSELEKQKNRAIETKSNFAFETNFANEMPLRLIEEFAKADYKISLCYFGLNSVEQCSMRVTQRKMNGGHNVSDDIVKFNFTEGTSKLRKSLTQFENLTFIDGNDNYGRIIAMHISRNSTHFVEDNPPQWFITNFSDPFESLKK